MHVMRKLSLKGFSSFLIPKPDGFSRLILNMKRLNQFIKCEHFKLEDDKTVRKLISETVDLKDAYYLIPIKEVHRRYLRFTFEDTLFEYTCLPFRMNSALYVFTKNFKLVIAHLRELGYVSVIYLDDLLSMGNSVQMCRDNVNYTCKFLQNVGFIINEEKSCFAPSNRFRYLGLIFDSQKMTMELPTDKQIRVSELMEKIKSKSSCKIREFAVFIGTLEYRCKTLKYGRIDMRAFER